jgi:hypothetical protein
MSDLFGLLRFSCTFLGSLDILNSSSVVDLMGKAGVVTMVAYLVVILGGKLHVATVLTMFVGGSAAAAFADVTIDAMVATKSRQKPELATHIQSLCSVCSSLGGLTGYLLSGLAVHLLGSQGALGIMLLPGVLLFVLGFVIYEPRLPHHLWYSGKVFPDFSHLHFFPPAPLAWM